MLDPITEAALIAGGGGLLRDGLNWFSQQGTNAQNERLMRESWRREDNSVQRRVADLKKAGLSPVLAAGQGASASAPIRIQAPQVQGNVAAESLKGAQDAMSLMSMQQNIENTRAQRDLIAAQTEASKSAAYLSKMSGDEVFQRQFRTMAETAQTEQNVAMTRENWMKSSELNLRSDIKSGWSADLTQAVNLIIGLLDKMGVKPKN